VSQMSARINQNIASVTAPQAALDQVDDECIGQLFGDLKVGVQREFFGEDWTRVLRNDILRYTRNEKMTVLNKDGAVTVEGRTNSGSSVVAANLARMCWIEPSATLTTQYAGLAEIISQLHALPYELNCKSGLSLQHPVDAVFQSAQLSESCRCVMSHFTMLVLLQ
jgi:hypothetical protein